jgi:hypothetical protein
LAAFIELNIPPKVSLPIKALKLKKTTIGQYEAIYKPKD